MKTTDIDPALLADLNFRAGLPDKRPLIDLINSLICLPAPKAPPIAPIAVSPGSVSSSFIDPATLATLSSLSATLSHLPGAVASTNGTRSEARVGATYEDISKARTALHRQLYDAFPLQCKTCALRFPNTPEGQQKLETHLDSHFKRNMRLKEISKKVLTRDWSAAEQDWIMGTERADTEKQGTLDLVPQDYLPFFLL